MIVDVLSEGNERLGVCFCGDTSELFTFKRCWLQALLAQTALKPLSNLTGRYNPSASMPPTAPISASVFPAPSVLIGARPALLLLLEAEAPLAVEEALLAPVVPCRVSLADLRVVAEPAELIVSMV